MSAIEPPEPSAGPDAAAVGAAAVSADPKSRESGADERPEDEPIVVGLSIPMPQPFSDELRRWRRCSGDRLADLVAPHITLVPPTPVPASRLEPLKTELAARCRAHPPFVVRLRGTGTFRPVSDVVFVAVAEGISNCEVLSDDLMVDELNVPRAFPYHPHVTVAQDVPEEALDAVFVGLEGFRADLIVREVWVHQQLSDGSWTPLRSLPLG